MSLSDKDLALTKKASRFGKVALVVAVFALALAIARGCYTYWVWVDRGELYFLSPHEKLLKILEAALPGGFTNAFFIFGAGLITLAVVKVVSAPAPPYWAAAMDDSFATKAAHFATALQIFAWVCALFTLLGGVEAAYSIVRNAIVYQDRNPSSLERVMTISFSTAYSTLNTLFTFILAAMIIKVLLVIASNAPPEARPNEKGTEGGQS